MYYLNDNEANALIGLLKLKRMYMVLEKREIGYKYKNNFQICVLNKIFSFNNYPSTEIRRDLSILLCLPQRSIQIWFQNTRQSIKDSKGFTSSEELKANTSMFSAKNNIENIVQRHTSEECEGNSNLRPAQLIEIYKKTKKDYKKRKTQP